MWDPQSPSDFSHFVPSDFPGFIAWWEREQLELLSSLFLRSYVDGLLLPFSEEFLEGKEIPDWLNTMLRTWQIAQWAYDQSIPIAEKLERSLEGLVPLQDYPGFNRNYRVTPADIAAVPEEIRRGFIESLQFSLSWIRGLSGDARENMRNILSVNQLKGSPTDAVPLLEQILRREVLGTNIEAGLKEATEQALRAIAVRAKTIANTESMRSLNSGALSAMIARGQKHCYIMPHIGTCPHCQRLLDGRVFEVQVLQRNLFTNFGRKSKDWVASLPQHPNCRHSILPVPAGFKVAILNFQVPQEGVVLQWFGLSEDDSNQAQIKLPKEWLLPNGKITQIS